MKKIKKISLIVIYSMLLVSCETLDFDLLDNPNNLTITKVDPDFLLNDIQLKFVHLVDEVTGETDELMRYLHMDKNYYDYFDAGSSMYSQTYRLTRTVQLIETLAKDNDDLLFHRGVAKILAAYSMTILVDCMGDVPYSEAISENTIPKVDEGEDIYMALLEELDLAITDLQSAIVVYQNDLYYSGDVSKWINLANSLKLKLHVNTGNITEINSLIAEDNLIADKANDFQFQYSSYIDPINSRHPNYSVYYDRVPVTVYGNYFLWLLTDSKSIIDPRIRYYVYRQTNDIDPSLNFPCIDNPVLNYDYCYIGDSYVGRDHGDNVSGGKYYGDLLTIAGTYPVGGAFDDDSFIPASDTENISGAGIQPILLLSDIEFLKAEAIVRLGVNGNAITSLEAGIRASMDKVINFDTSTLSSSFSATSTNVDDYIIEVLNEYNLTTSNEEKLDIIVREHYIAGYGNSYEAYNAYRRTGFPSTIQVPVVDDHIPFVRSFPISEAGSEHNPNIPQESVITDQVFWDTNPPGFIK